MRQYRGHFRIIQSIPSDDSQGMPKLKIDAQDGGNIGELRLSAMLVSFDSDFDKTDLKRLEPARP